ncbi:MAG: hypothetical protein DKINENOH_01721 [bacterium]|nr:hypothetical protein [bacterium]
MLTFLFFVAWRYVRYCLSRAAATWCELHPEFYFLAHLHPAIASRERFCFALICGLIFALGICSSSLLLFW